MYIFLCVTALLSLYLLKLMFYRISADGPLPPGPKPLPIVRNVRDMPASGSAEWLHWLKHKELYGPICTVSVLGQRLVILNDARIAFDLLEKKSAIYSDRPELPFASLCGMGEMYIHREMGSRLDVARFNPIQDTEVHRFLLRLLNAPQNLPDYAGGLAGSLTSKVLCGYRMDHTRKDLLLHYIEEALRRFIPAMVPEAWLVNSLPFCLLFGFVKQQIEAGVAGNAGLPNLLLDKHVRSGSQEENDIKSSAVSLYFGGISTITSVFLAMVLYPDVQKRAQEELDLVIGQGRLPGFADRDCLPYINAVVKEALRWHPVTPTGVAHSVTEDDVYDGYYIPKGSVIMPNIWAFYHDLEDYKDPMSFKSERFLGDKPEQDPQTLVFGFGGRVCPGRVLADSSIYLTIAMSLAALSISKPVRDGEEVDVQPHFMPGVTSHPALFELDIRLRDARYEQMILSVQGEHPWGTEDADLPTHGLGRVFRAS
ncbi:cytochrome P450 [Aspergillus foveolatus]|uniref:cytochrome P450 n=1 Tax=Aspergillus foveolatus TaxID=210207 RepID=UPI003CCE4E52